jgi:hypothetical protein
MDDRRKQALRVQFGGKLKLEFHGAKITSDAGLLPFRELDEAFRLTEKGSTVLSDPRPGISTQHTMPAMLRHSAYGRVAGWSPVFNRWGVHDSQVDQACEDRCTYQRELAMSTPLELAIEPKDPNPAQQHHRERGCQNLEENSWHKLRQAVVHRLFLSPSAIHNPKSAINSRRRRATTPAELDL